MAKATLATEQVRVVESLAGVGSQVDAAAGIIRGVKLIGFESKNGRTYPPDVLRSAVSLYEGAKVNVDHPRNAGDPRSVADRIGVIKGARFVEGKGVYGDFHFNPKHQLAEQVAWDAQNNPDAVGFSHNATLKFKALTASGKKVVESIHGVRSLDLVADPATTSGFFESQDSTTHDEDEAMDFSKLTLEDLRKERPDLIKTVAEQRDESAELEDLREKVKTLEAREAKAKLEGDIRTALEAAGLDPKDKAKVSDLFMEQLVGAKDAAAREALIADRKAIVGAIKSQTTEGRRTETPKTTQATEGAVPSDSAGWLKRLTSRSKSAA